MRLGLNELFQKPDSNQNQADATKLAFIEIGSATLSLFLGKGSTGVAHFVALGGFQG
jgi:hypothetical protein